MTELLLLWGEASERGQGSALFEEFANVKNGAHGYTILIEKELTNAIPPKTGQYVIVRVGGAENTHTRAQVDKGAGRVLNT